MVNLLKKLFSTRDGPHTVVVINDDGTKPSSSYRLNPISLWSFTIGVIFLVITLVVVLLRFTPVGGLVYDQEELRKSVIDIQQKVAGLQDTIEARNMQLQRMQRIIAAGADTTFNLSSAPQQNPAQTSVDNWERVLPEYEIQQLPANTVLISNLLQKAPDFPASYPVQGTTTRRFDINNGHYGLDIAVQSGTAFHAIADGVILSREWTFDYGYVIVVQHADGILTIYKHAQTVNKATGDVVRRGDVLGTLGDIGILSSGPHIHIEVWKNGIPLNPQNYLINSTVNDVQ